MFVPICGGNLTFGLERYCEQMSKMKPVLNRLFYLQHLKLKLVVRCGTTILNLVAIETFLRRFSFALRTVFAKQISTIMQMQSGKAGVANRKLDVVVESIPYLFIFTHPPLMLLAFCLALIIYTSHSIQFNYNLPKYQIQCFHQSVEKDSRYQISVKGETSMYYLHVVENQAVHEDSRSKNAEFKQYSAFANSTTIITFCLGNLGDESIYFDIQFYHGIFLEDSFEANVQGRELQDLSDRWVNMIKMVESNYDIYKRHLFGRRSSSQRITTVLSFMVVVIILGTALVKVVYYRKITAFLKAKKVV